MARVSRMRARLSTPATPAPGPRPVGPAEQPLVRWRAPPTIDVVHENRVDRVIWLRTARGFSTVRNIRRTPMATNGRFLTTHVGSLPRPDDLIAMMWAREDGIPVDRAAMEERVCRAVDEAVVRQIQAGIDIVNDGEWGKPSYATYIKDRLNGFGGTGNTYVFQDIEAFPATKARVLADPGRKHRKAPACDAPISVRDMEAPRTDADRLKRALKTHGAAGGFLTAAS